MLVGFAMYATNLIVPQVMQLPRETGYGFGQTMLQMGLWMAPMGLGTMAVSNLGAHISRTRGAKVTLSLAGWVIVVGCGVGFAFGAMPTVIMSAVPAGEKAAANAFNSLMRSIGLTSSAAVIGTILAATSQHNGDTAVPSLFGFVVSLLVGCAAAILAAIVAAAIPGGKVGPASRRP